MLEDNKEPSSVSTAGTHEEENVAAQAVEKPAPIDINSAMKCAKPEAITEEPDPIEVHPMIMSDLGSLPVLDTAEEEAFREIFDILLYEYDARTFAEQCEVFDQAQRIVEGRRLQHLQVRAVGGEMKPAAEMLFRKQLDPTNRISPALDAEAKKLAEANRVPFEPEAGSIGDYYSQEELEAEGFGPFPIDTEAAKRAMPILSVIEKLRASNERGKANGQRALARIKAMKRKRNG